MENLVGSLMQLLFLVMWQNVKWASLLGGGVNKKIKENFQFYIPSLPRIQEWKGSSFVQLQWNPLQIQTPVKGIPLHDNLCGFRVGILWQVRSCFN